MNLLVVLNFPLDRQLISMLDGADSMSFDIICFDGLRRTRGWSVPVAEYELVGGSPNSIVLCKSLFGSRFSLFKAGCKGMSRFLPENTMPEHLRAILSV